MALDWREILLRIWRSDFRRRHAEPGRLLPTVAVKPGGGLGVSVFNDKGATGKLYTHDGLVDLGGFVLGSPRRSAD